jgi:hypothetical protein
MEEHMDATVFKTLKDRLIDWTDDDVAAFSLAVVLGLVADGQDSFARVNKHLFWTDNVLLHTLTILLKKLVGSGILRKNTNDQYKWNELYDPNRSVTEI